MLSRANPAARLSHSALAISLLDGRIALSCANISSDNNNNNNNKSGNSAGNRSGLRRARAEPSGAKVKMKTTLPASRAQL